ncbi:20672_t:CDS:2 [Cetraspora pellucida]|uniref:20672_t:CDS:1 n=1 Tax=Cetraspora pellucida TaxID=1433469 RepID=A0A9N9GA66_9GLOM|nr:20672_t:CDS:2 [Cetraspora pellucida]
MNQPRYHSNPQKLWKDLKAEGYQFPYKKVCEWLTKQNEWQKHAPPLKDTPQVTKILYKVQYAVESITSNSKLIRAWVKHLPKVIDYLNNYPTRLIRAPGSSKWDDLESQRKRDQKKQEICKEQDIDLIEILYGANLFPYIKHKLQEKGYLQNIDINSISKSDYSSE